MSRRSWTKEQLEMAVKESKSYRQVLQKLGLREAGGNYFQVKKYIREAGLDAKHFKGRAWNKGLRGVLPLRVPLEKILVRNRFYRSYKLKLRLFREGLKNPQCELCGWSQSTSDGYTPVELDHINGDPLDNRLENLQILCPNCHSLTPTYRSRKRKS